MTLPRYGSIDEIQTALFEKVIAAPSATPRGMETRELIAQGFTLESPRKRVLHSPVRRWSLALAIGELAWHLAGSDDVEHMAYYAPLWRTFSDDGAHIRGSCYGKRLFDQSEAGDSQWDRLVRLLRLDSSTRRAVLNLQQPPAEALDGELRDVSCVTSCQVFIRDGLLEMSVHMRSNDVVWGLPYDVFLFTMLQEFLSVQLGVQLGPYHHFAGSLHVYSRHYNLVHRVLSSDVDPGPSMPVMTSLDQVPNFLEAERCIRSGAGLITELSPYWAQLLEPVRKYAHQRATGLPNELGG